MARAVGAKHMMYVLSIVENMEEYQSGRLDG
jgi:hypothetical protein